jgi:hypothetical protein
MAELSTTGSTAPQKDGERRLFDFYVKELQAKLGRQTP